MKMTMAAESIKAHFIGNDAEFSGVSIDSRKIENNHLFLALKGPNHDAHDYVKQAEANGAIGFVVNKQVAVTAPQMIVSDTHTALGELASVWRKKLVNTKFIAITGSNGKTTVKEMLASILSVCGSTIATKGNLNNDIGMPLTLLSVKPEHQYAVIEMGANHAKEIDYLSHIAQPHVALVNNAGAAHLEGFGSIEGVAKAKAEIYSHLVDDGIAIINFDDKYADYWLDINKNRNVLTFSLGNSAADITGEIVKDQLLITYLDQQVKVRLPLPGEHNLRNALAATAMAVALDICLEKVKQGLELLHVVNGRLNIISVADDNIIIDDTYNANPLSFQAAIQVLAKYEKNTCLIMGDMAELGNEAEQQHADIGLYAKNYGINTLYSCGALSKSATEKFGDAGIHFSNKQSLMDYIKNNTYKNTVFLVKGSRSMAMEELVEFLKGYIKNAGI